MIGTLVGGVLGQSAGLRPTLVVGACAAVVAAVWLALSPVGALRDSTATGERLT